MRSRMKAVCVSLTMIAVGMVSGCGGGSGSGSAAAPQSSTPGTGGASASPAPAQLSAGAALYASKCATCHGDITTTSIVTPTDSTNIKGAISANTGGMGMFASMSDADIQLIADAVNNPTAVPVTPPVTPPVSDGATLYAAKCAGCHGVLASSAKTGASASAIQTAINNNTGGMGSLSALTPTQVSAISAVLSPAVTPPPVTPPATDGATLYATKCAGCHGVLASSAKVGASASAIQTAINNNTGGMGSLSVLTPTQVSAIATVLAPVVTPPPVTTPVTDGATLYATKCAGCHGVLASSAKAGASTSAIQTAINNNTGGMGSLSTLTATQVGAISTVLAGVTATPTPPPACGSCHAIPPVTGRHAKHKSQNIACATCHGSGYSTTTVNAATHNNGVKNLTTTIGWNATSRSCSNSCHGSKTW